MNVTNVGEVLFLEHVRSSGKVFTHGDKDFVIKKALGIFHNEFSTPPLRAAIRESFSYFSL